MSIKSWATLPLGDDRVADLDRGVSWSKADESDDGVGIVGIPNVRIGEIDYTSLTRLSRLIDDRKLIRSGDILLVGSSGAVKNVGRSAIVRENPVTPTAFASFVVRVRPSTAMNPYFLAFVLQSRLVSFEAHSKKAADGKYNLQLESLRGQSIPLPPKDEQNRIAALLIKTHSALELEEKLIIVGRELKRAVLREVFTHGLKGAPSEESEIGPMPSKWALRPFHELREFLQYGTSVKCGYEVAGQPVLRIPNVVDGRIDATDIKRCSLSNKEITSLRLIEGDILFIRTNGVRDRVGTCAVYSGSPEGSLFASYLIRARPKRGELDPQFFQYYSSTQAGAAFLSGRSSPAADGKFNINTKTIDSVLVPMPKLNEQQEIVAALRKVDSFLEIHERRRVTLRELFASLLDNLITGTVRVDKLDIDTSGLVAA